MCLANALLMSLTDRSLIADWTVRKCGMSLSRLNTGGSCDPSPHVLGINRIKLAAASDLYAVLTAKPSL